MVRVAGILRPARAVVAVHDGRRFLIGRVGRIEPQHVLLARLAVGGVRVLFAGRVGIQDLHHAGPVGVADGKAGFHPGDLPVNLRADGFVFAAVVRTAEPVVPAPAGAGGVQFLFDVL